MGLKPSSVAPKIVETTFDHGGGPVGQVATGVVRIYAVEMSYGQF